MDHMPHPEIYNPARDEKCELQKSPAYESMGRTQAYTTETHGRIGYNPLTVVQHLNSQLGIM